VAGPCSEANFKPNEMLEAYHSSAEIMGKVFITPIPLLKLGGLFGVGRLRSGLVLSNCFLMKYLHTFAQSSCARCGPNVCSRSIHTHLSSPPGPGQSHESTKLGRDGLPLSYGQFGQSASPDP
jgi:hypothetical protein